MIYQCASYGAENIVGKGENAGFQYFLFSHYVFKSFFPSGLLTLNHTRFLTTLRKRPFENFKGRGENAGNQYFLLFPQCLLRYPKTQLNFSVTFICCLQIPFNLDQCENFLFSNGIKKESLISQAGSSVRNTAWVLWFESVAQPVLFSGLIIINSLPHDPDF